MHFIDLGGAEPVTNHAEAAAQRGHMSVLHFANVLIALQANS